MLMQFKENLALTSMLAMTVFAGTLAVSRVDFIQQNAAVLGGFYQKSVEADFNETFPLGKFSQDFWTAAKLTVFNQTHSEVIHSQDGWLFTAEEFRQPANDVVFSAEMTWVLKELNTVNVDLIPVIIPDKARIYADKLPHARTPALEARYDLVLSELNELGLSPIDLRTVLLEVRNNTEPFLKTDTHWSPEAANHIAATVASLADQNINAGSVFTTEWRDAEPFYGDLIDFVETGLFETIVGFAADEVSLPVTTAQDAGMSLFGDVEFPAALVGTSYSAKETFNFVGFLKEHLEADVLNAAQVGRGPFVPMRDYLASDDFLNSPPKLIIWEIPERYISTEEFDR
jgi:alginate O-acetyltransferase complex protein AlgJ